MLREAYLGNEQDLLQPTVVEDDLVIEGEEVLSVESHLSLMRIQLPADENTVEWELVFETLNDYTCFHVYFEGWKHTEIGITY